MAGCSSSSGNENGEVPDSWATVALFPATPNPDLDILLVVDNSPTMALKQASFAGALPRFLDRLRQPTGVLPNLHVGVVSTDMGTKGSISDEPGPAVGTMCKASGDAGVLQTNPASTNGLYISDAARPDGTRETNYAGSLASVLTTRVNLGDDGCGFEQPLAAMRAALDHNPANAGFLRDTAALLVVLLTDEDDCSIHDPVVLSSATTTYGPLQSFRCTRYGVTCATNGATQGEMNQIGGKDRCTPSPDTTLLDGVQPFHDFLIGLKPSPSQVAVAAVMGPLTPFTVELRSPTASTPAVPALAHSCMFTNQAGQADVADPPVRLAAFLDTFGSRAIRAPICDADLSTSLDGAAQLALASLGSACILELPTDQDPATPGRQPVCIVEDVTASQTTRIPACDDNKAAAPCWRFEEDAACPGDEHLKLVVTRDADVAPDTTTRARCEPAPPSA